MLEGVRTSLLLPTLLLGCSDPLPASGVRVDAAVASEGGTDASVPIRGDAGLPPFCTGKAYSLCEDFESGIWAPGFATLLDKGGELSVTAETDMVARALRARAPKGGTAFLNYPVRVDSGATLSFALRVSAIAGDVTVLRLALRKDTTTDIVLKPYPDLPRAVAYLVHREPGMPENSTAIANFVFDRFVEVSITLPPLGATQPLHAVVGSDLRAVSLLGAEPAAQPMFAVGAADATESFEGVVDDITLDYVK